MLFRNKSICILLFVCFASTAISRAQSHKSLYKSAIENEKQKQLPAAIDDLLKAIELKPDYLKAYDKLIKIYVETKAYEKALSIANKALAIKSSTDFYFSRAYINNELKNYQASIDDYSTVLESRRKYACAFNNRGIVYENQKKYNEALFDYKKVLDLDKNLHSFVNSNLGNVYHSMGDYQNAIMHFNEAILQDPQDVKVYGHAKGIFPFSAKWKQIPILKQEENWTNKYGDTYIEKGKLLMQLGKYAEAIDVFKQSLAVNPNNQFAIANIGLCLWFVGKNEESVKYLQTNSAFNCVENAYLYFAHLQLNQAIDAMNFVLKDASNKTGMLNLNRAFIYTVNGMYDSVINDCNTVLKYDDANSSMYNYRGFAHFMLGNYTEALVDCKKAVQYAKPNFQPLFQYQKAAELALSGIKETIFPTQFIWLQPTFNVNDLINTEVLLTDGLVKLKLLLLANHAIEKDEVKLYVESKQNIETNATTTLAQLPNNTANKLIQYQWNGMVKLPKGKHTVYIAYKGAISQKINCIVE